MITVNNLVKAYGDHVVLNGVSEHIAPGEKVVVIGPSGSGKSTFLRCLNLLEVPTSGEIVFDGQCITAPHVNIDEVRRHMCMVFQHFNLFNNMSVERNLTLAPVKLKLMGADEAHERAMTLLERVGLPDKADAYPGQLSGGQKQRVAIARALAMEPEVLLLDEVTAALDPEMVREVLDVILGLAKEGKTMIIVTHEMQFARAVADRVLFFDGGEIVEQDIPERFFECPQSNRAKKFLHTFEFDAVRQHEA